MPKLATQFQELGDVKIAFCEAGEGPALILLHGNSESKAIFARYQQEDFKDFHTLALDSRGHGESVSEDESYSIEQYSQDVIRFCKARGITRAFVIGYSDGGNIALFLAQKEPALFPKIAAISPNYLVSGTTDGALLLMKIVAGTLRLLGRLGLRTRKALAKIDLMLTDIGITDEELGSIRTSVRILYAEKDLIKEQHILQMGRLIPGAAVRKIAGCNHLNILHKPEAIRDMREYLLD
jgi:pimeloyl-ACP methyl ester carboxylesterase